VNLTENRRYLAAWLLAFALGFAALSPAFALDPNIEFRDYAIDNWDVDSGLPQVSILSITQDQTGYLWIGTQSGIARFDGVRYLVFNRHNSNGVNPNEASHSLCDRHGNLYFGTYRGLLRRANHRFEPLGPQIQIRGLIETESGEIWAATTQGIYRYVDGSRIDPLPGAPEAHSLARDGSAVMIGGLGKLLRRSTSGDVDIELPEELAKVPLTKLAVSVDGLWIGTSIGLYFWSAQTGKVSRQTLGKETPGTAPSGIQSVFVDRDTNLWIGTPMALFRRRPNGNMERIPEQDFKNNSFVVSAFEDREGQLWLGSLTEGLFRLWNGWASRIGDGEGLKDRLTWSVTLSPEQQLVIGSNSNISRLTEGGPEELVSAAQLGNRTPYELSYDLAGRLWIGTRNGLLIHADGVTGIPAEFESLARLQINAIVPLADGGAWIGSSGGLYRYQNGTLRHIDKLDGAPTEPVRSILVQQSGPVLVGTEVGMLELDADSKLRRPTWAAALDGVYVSTMRILRPGLIGIGTRDAGFGLLAGNRLAIYDEGDGLPSNNSWTAEVVNGQLYVSTIDGVWRVPVAELPDPASASDARFQSKIVLGRTTGIQHIHCCNGGAHTRSLVVGEHIWYPAIHGVVRVNTELIAAPPTAPTLVIEGLRNLDKWFDPDAKILIGTESRDVELQFTGLSFRDPKNLRFRYRLEGYDQTWQLAGTRRNAFYTNLPPGRYRFRVESLSATPGAQSGFDVLEFKVQPHWFERRVVQAGIALVLLGLVALIPLLLQLRFRMRGRLLEALVATRTVELSEASAHQRQANLALSESNAALLREVDERAAAESTLHQRNTELVALTQKLEGTQNQLLQSERMASVGQLAAGVAHEINNPIGYVQSNLNSLARYVEDIMQLVAAYERSDSLIAASDARAATILREIKQRIELDFIRTDLRGLLAESQQGIVRVVKIVKDLKNFSHVDESEWQIVDIHAGLESTLNVVAHDLKYKAELVRDYAKTPPIECLPFQLNQVFLNLLINAVHAIPEQGVITITTRSDENELTISVRDTGTGIAPDVVNRIFDPFFTTKPIGQGTGLGLSVSYGIIQRHGGRIDVVSAVGVGTTFTVHLPLRRAPSESADGQLTGQQTEPAS